ncbi:hypothetical protein GTY67_34410 [Streptomyces sp. SID8374]|uniref:hypothetical protein n=1 Tax=Streptomyces sp. SID8374 TaxID=2690354 RepID=UPI00136A3531|nr:hypothetical protein [Streptomyces sp. SID8374]MYX18444.1 hypothetical protein [Streptomyces sp. SID8374]
MNKNKPSRLKSFFFGLIGQAYVCESAEEVREAITESAFTASPGRVQAHARGAGGLSDSLAFQPGLLDLHDDLHDAWHYLTALKARARDLGNGALVDHLGAAADSTRDVLQAVAAAAENTVPSPALPAHQ